MISNQRLASVAKSLSKKCHRKRKKKKTMSLLMIQQLAGNEDAHDSRSKVPKLTFMSLNSVTDDEFDICMVCNGSGEMVNCRHCDMKCHAKCAKPPVKRSKMSDWKCWKCTSVQQRSDRIKRRRLDKGSSH